MTRNNKNPYPGLFGNVDQETMQAITEKYLELTKLTDLMLIKNKKALASVGSTRKEK